MIELTEPKTASCGCPNPGCDCDMIMCPKTDHVKGCKFDAFVSRADKDRIEIQDLKASLKEAVVLIGCLKEYVYSLGRCHMCGYTSTTSIGHYGGCAVLVAQDFIRKNRCGKIGG